MTVQTMPEQAKAAEDVAKQPPEKSDFEKLLEREFRPNSNTERVLMQRQTYWWLARRFHASGFFANKFRSEDAIFSAMLYGARFGWDPWTSLQNCYIVNGNVAQSSASMLGIAVASGATYEIRESGKNGNPGQIGEWCELTMHREGFKPVVKTWTQADVRRAEIKGIHGKYPSQMLQWRCVADACRFLFPDKLCGVVATEEIDAHLESLPEVPEGARPPTPEPPKRRSLKPHEPSPAAAPSEPSPAPTSTAGQPLEESQPAFEVEIPPEDIARDYADTMLLPDLHKLLQSASVGSKAASDGLRKAMKAAKVEGAVLDLSEEQVRAVAYELRLQAIAK